MVWDGACLKDVAVRLRSFERGVGDRASCLRDAGSQELVSENVPEWPG